MNDNSFRKQEPMNGMHGAQVTLLRDGTELGKIYAAYTLLVLLQDPTSVDKASLKALGMFALCCHRNHVWLASSGCASLAFVTLERAPWNGAHIKDC
eukprot:scaffold33296_cov24-Tisochrysis_lutea.AAC.2